MALASGRAHGWYPVKPFSPEELRRLREERQLSLRAASERTNGQLSWQALNRLELGERDPQLKSLSAIAVAYDIVIIIDNTKVLIG